MRSTLVRPNDVARVLIAVLYTRVSRDRSARRKSVTEQDFEGRAAAHERGWHIPDDAAFTDNDISASRFASKPRTGWDALLAYLATRPVHVLIVWEVSRGDRRLGPWISLLDLCRDRGILIHVVKDDETYDPRKGRDRKALAQEGIAAEAESEAVSDRIKRDKRLAAMKGRPSGRLNYGYLREYDGRGRYVRQVKHPTQAAIVREMATEVDAGTPLRQVAAELNRRRAKARRTAWDEARRISQGNGDWPTRWRAVRAAVSEGRVWDTPEGGPWGGFQIRQLLLKPVYAGLRVHQGAVVGKGNWPAILDEGLYHRVRARLTDPVRRNANDNTLAYQLSGAALCGVCRRPLRTLRRITYRCCTDGCLRVGARIVAMDAVVDQFIIARLRRPDAAAVFSPVASDAALDAARAEVRQLRELLEEHYELASARKLSPAGLAAMESRLLPQIEAAEARVRALSVPPVLRSLDPVRLAESWPNEPVHLRREVINALAEIVLSPAGKGVRFTATRLGESRWRGDDLTWGQHWERAARG